MKTEYRRLLRTKVLYVTPGKDCIRIDSDATREVEELVSNQEEADSRLLFHAAHAAKEGYENIVMA